MLTRFAAALAERSDDARASAEQDARAALDPFVGPDGLGLPLEAQVATACR